MVFAIERYGYEVDQKKSSANSLCLKSSQDKILVSRDTQSGNYVYASLFNDADKGSIIDFVQHRTRQSLGHVRKELRAYQGNTVSSNYERSQQQQKQTAVVPTKAPFDREAVTQGISQEGITPTLVNRYLTQERHIAPHTLALPRFNGSIFSDTRGNAVFLHQDTQGVCGYEKRNANLKHFSKGGKRALWSSNCYHHDTRLVITESPIDSLALAQMSGWSDRTRYLATSGSLSQETKKLLVLAAQKIRQRGGVIIAAMDNDTAGKKMTKELIELIQADQIAVPKSNDWSEDLAQLSQSSHSNQRYDEQEQSM